MEKIIRKKPLVFLDICIDGAPAERMVFELFTDVAPKTAENFRVLCTGEKGVSSETGKPLHYKGTFFHLIIKGHVAQAGDFLRQAGKFGESIYGGKFPGESPKLKHDGPGLLTMAMGDRDERGSLFYVTFKADHHLDRKSVVFGRLVDGLEVLKKIETAGDEEGNPTVTVKIINSGELPEGKKKWTRLKMGNDTIIGNYNADRRKGKQKKSSKKRKKRRKYYTSESDSTTDTDMESSESDSDSDSYDTSLSDTSSSSDDHRRKRKRSKRDKKKHGKRKDRRREKRRKRRDRKTKRKSKRNNSTDSENVSKSGSSSEDNDVVEALDGKRKSSRNQSPVQQREISTINHKKGDDAGGMSESEEGGFPKENGNHQGNGIGPEMESDQSPDRHPDPVDNHPSKSRSRNLSPRRTLSKNMSLSPRKDARRSPSVSGSPQQIFNKSKSNSPVRSESSRSPIRSPPRITKGINRSMSPPVRSPSRQSRSRSPMVSPPRRRVAQSPPRTSSRRSSHRSLSRSPKRPLHRSVSRSSGRAPPPRRSPSPSPVRAPNRITRRSYSRSPVSAGRRARSPVSDRGRSSSRSRSVEHGSPKRIRRGRGFSDRYSYVRRYRSRSPDRSPIRSYRYGGRGDRDRYSSYRRSPRRYRSPPRGRTPPRYRGRRSRTRSPSVSRSPIRTRKRRSSPSRSPVRSNSPVDRYKAPVRGERLKSKSPSRSRSRSKSRSSRDSRSPRHADKVNSRSSPEGSPQKAGLVSYEDGSPNSGRN